MTKGKALENFTSGNSGGIWAGPPVFWDEKLQLDEKNTVENFQRICEIQLRGIYILGTTGEFYSLDIEETYNHIRYFVRHLYLHDGFYSPQGKIEVCFLGEEIINHKMPMWLLRNDDFSGYFSMETISKGEPEKWLKQYAEELAQIKERI